LNLAAGAACGRRFARSIIEMMQTPRGGAGRVERRDLASRTVSQVERH
jgi:hypothetical protein